VPFVTFDSVPAPRLNPVDTSTS